MWEEISEKFHSYPSRKEVAIFLLSKGLRVSGEGKIYLGEVEIPHSKIARVIDIDRRVVDSTAKKIAEDEKLLKIFSCLDVVPFLKDVAPLIGLSVLIITPTDASRPGIVGQVSSMLAKKGVPIRQVIADDPYLSRDPKLTIITDQEIEGGLLNRLKRVRGVKEITFF